MPKDSVATAVEIGLNHNSSDSDMELKKNTDAGLVIQALSSLRKFSAFTPMHGWFQALLQELVKNRIRHHVLKVSHGFGRR